MSTSRLQAATSVTDWPERLLLIGLLVAGLLAVLGLMRLGWVRRARRQTDIPPLPSVPPISPAAIELSAVPARYLGTTRAGDWLDRIVVHGLGAPSAGEVTVAAEGVWCSRPGAADLFLPADRVVSARHDRGLAGRVYERGGVLVVTWRHGGVDLDTGLRVPDADAAERLRQAIAELAGGSARAEVGSGGGRR